jgi:hypothetical protein
MSEQQARSAEELMAILAQAGTAGGGKVLNLTDRVRDVGLANFHGALALLAFVQDVELPVAFTAFTSRANAELFLAGLRESINNVWPQEEQRPSN